MPVARIASASSADFGKAEVNDSERNAVPVRKLKWVAISCKRNETNESLRTANNPRRVSSCPVWTKSSLSKIDCFCYNNYKKESFMNKFLVIIKIVIMFCFLFFALMCLPHISINFRTLLPLFVLVAIFIAIVILLKRMRNK